MSVFSHKRTSGTRAYHDGRTSSSTRRDHRAIRKIGQDFAARQSVSKTLLVQDLTRFGTVRFSSLRESKTFLAFTVLGHLDDLHERLPFGWSQSMVNAEICGQTLAAHSSIAL